MSYRYAVLGAGRQGIAAAYDLGVFGDAQYIILADKNYAAAKNGANLVNRLLANTLVVPLCMDVTNRRQVEGNIVGINACISAMHYALNPELTDLAIRAGVHMCDLGGNTDIVRLQHMYTVPAIVAGVSVIPDCGMGPGMNLSLARYVMAKVSHPETVRIFCGGLPQPHRRRPPLNYELLFNIEGLINEYSGFADVLREGKVVKIPALTEWELKYVTGVGELVAAFTAGGLSTAPWTLPGKFPTLQRLEYKTLRYPGHWEIILQTAQAGSMAEYLRKTLTPSAEAVHDLGIIRVECSGRDAKNNHINTAAELIDRYDAKSGFTAMQRLTGFHASIMAILAANGVLPPGVVPVESVDGELIVAEARKRGFEIRATP